VRSFHPPQILTLSVARWCTVEGSTPDDTRLIVQWALSTHAGVPGWLAATLRLSGIALTNQSAFNWLDLRSYDIRVAEQMKAIHLHTQL
jgi:hypothetical protein